MFLASTLLPAQNARPETGSIISLEHGESRAEAALPLVKGEPSFAGAPENFHAFAATQAGELGPLDRLNLHFSATTKLTKIESTKDFRVEQGSSCVEGNVYGEGGSCTLLVRFTPKGAGRRSGRVTIQHTASATPLYVGLGGNSYSPVVSFTPSVISTVPASYPASAGLLLNAKNLAVDGGDSLYVADTGNNVVRILDSSGAFKTIASSGIVAPVGIAVDNFGETFFSEPTQNLVYEIFEYGSVIQLNGVGVDTCTVAAPCSMTSEKVYTPGMMGIDSSNQLFFEDGNRGAAVAVVQPYPATLARLYDPFTYQTTSTGVFTVDQYDNLYTVWSITGLCQINAQTYSDSANSRAVYKKIVGGKFCGFAGDGGPARNAEIGATIGQMAFDIAGNMYFTDAANQRVRRIDYSTGQISTIAGTGVAGYGGDGNMATAATLSSPTGVGVDSQGQVYIISSVGSAGQQVIRKIGTTGLLAFGSQATGTASAAKVVTVSNTGNSTLTWNNVVVTGTNPGDFTIDPLTTTCNLVAQGTLVNGQSCVVGILFKPGAAGSRSASLRFLDNTVTNSNTVLLTGTGGSAAKLTATVAISSPPASASYASGTSVKFTATVSGAGPTPTGTLKFALDGTLISSTVALSGGTGSINYTVTGTGTHTAAFAYAGDANYNSTGSVSRTFTVTAAAKAPAAVTLASPANPASSCKPVLFAVKVGSSETAKPTGTVVLKDGATMLGTMTLANGVATLSVPSLAAGTHTMSAVYSGDASFATAGALLKQVVTASTGCTVLRTGPVGVQPVSVRPTVSEGVPSESSKRERLQ